MNSKSNPESSKNSKSSYIIYIVAGLIFIITGSAFLYYFMNKYTAREHYREALMLEENKAYIAAFEQYSDAIEYDSRYGDAYHKRALLRMNLSEDFEGAARDISMAIKYSTVPSSQLHYIKAICHLKKNMPTDALYEFDQMLKINPKLDSVHLYKGDIYYNNNQYQECVNSYAMFLDKHPHANGERVKKAYCLYQLNKYEEALEEYNKAISFNKTNPELYYLRGTTWLQMKDSANACADMHLAKALGMENLSEEIKKICMQNKP